MDIARRSKYSVTFYEPSKAYDGCTLFSVAGRNDVWIINMQGQIVHHWDLPYPAGEYGCLLSNGNLFYQGSVPIEEAPLPTFGGIGGHLLEVDWDNNLVSKYDDLYHTHDAQRMENGNFMIVRYVPAPKSITSRVRGGIPGTEHEGTMWANVLREVDPNTGKVAWEWLAYEHLDPESDIICPSEQRIEWTHCNTVQILANGDILTSFRSINTIAIIDKKTGDIKWKWGPGELCHQHDPTMLDSGNILIFDNGAHRRSSGPSYSRVLEVNPKTNRIEWEYKDNPVYEFFSGVAGGCQRLPNGNTLITESCLGRIFEVTLSGELVWEFVNPFYSYWQDQHQNFIYRAYRYGPNYEGLKGKKLTPMRFNLLNQLYGPSAFEE